jgi:hypothetical protein
VRNALVVMVVLAIGPTVLKPSVAQAAEIKVLVPAYFYPTWWVGSPWDDLNAAAARIPVEAIMNPASGPGTGPNSDYQYAVAALQASGGRVIGYVSTAYGARSADDIIADVQAYLDWYEVDGIFLDEMGNQNGSLDYLLVYSTIKAMAEEAEIDLHIVGNAGMPFAPVEGFLPAADTLVIFEGPLTSADPNGASFCLYPKQGPYSGLPLWFTRYPGSRFANLVFEVPSAEAMVLGLLKAVGYNADYVYLTDDVLPNPWDTLPAYWNIEVDLIALVNRLFKF